MDFVQQLRQPLNLVNYHHRIARREFLHDPAGILAQSQVRCSVKQIVDSHIRERLADEKGLARLSRSKQEVRLLLNEPREVEDPLHGGFSISHVLSDGYVVIYHDI